MSKYQDIQDSYKAIEHDRQRDNEAYEQALMSVDKQWKDIQSALHSKIKRHFKGIVPSIHISEYGLAITFEDKYILDHVYEITSFNGITRNLAYKIIDEYNEVYGQVKGYGDILSDGCTRTIDKSLLVPHTGHFNGNYYENGKIK